MTRVSRRLLRIRGKRAADLQGGLDGWALSIGQAGDTGNVLRIVYPFHAPCAPFLWVPYIHPHGGRHNHLTNGRQIRTRNGYVPGLFPWESVPSVGAFHETGSEGGRRPSHAVQPAKITGQ